MSGGASNSTGTATTKCGLFEVIIFLAAIAFGTACSICSKTMMSLHAAGSDGIVQSFEKPIFQTIGMFIGMMFGLVMHVVVVMFKIPFPGYDHGANRDGPSGDQYGDGISNRSLYTIKSISETEDTMPEISSGNGTRGGRSPLETDQLLPRSSSANSNSSNSRKGVPLWMYFFLAIPSIFDLGATALCMMGLRYLDVSIYQLLRGSGIIFVALMKQHVLGDVLYRFQWLGVFWNVISVMFVGMAAVLNSTTNESKDPKEAVLGILLVMAGAFVQALQFVFEEKVMAMDEAAAPPLLLIGMEGLWGTFLCLVVVYPVVYYMPGDDHGSYEDPFSTYDQFINSETIQYAFVIYFFTIFGYNLLAVLVTYALNSIWHAILDNFRPITVWCTDMFIFYVIVQSGDFGEPWMKYSWVQLLGMFVLLYGTAVYNAPNSGSIFLRGEWYSFYIDLSHEYEAIEREHEEEQLDMEWKIRQESFHERRKLSSFAERSPHISIHTQALGGLGTAQHM